MPSFPANTHTEKVALLLAGPHPSWCLLSHSGATSQERHSCSLFRELQARSVVESPTCTQGSFLFRAGACHGRSWGRKKDLGTILGLARAPQAEASQQRSFHEHAIQATVPSSVALTLPRR